MPDATIGAASAPPMTASARRRGTDTLVILVASREPFVSRECTGSAFQLERGQKAFGVLGLLRAARPKIDRLVEPMAVQHHQRLGLLVAARDVNHQPPRRRVVDAELLLR